MNEFAIMADVKRRLVAMVMNPPYVFQNTPQELIDKYIQYLTTFIGYSTTEVALFESELNVHFPQVFRAYLLEMGKSSGDLFVGTAIARNGDFSQFRADALELMAETDPELTLPVDAVVYWFHQGYTFSYIQANGGFDSPVFQWVETHREAKEITPTFADVLDAELRLAEKNHANFHKRGGYYVTLFPKGGR